MRKLLLLIPALLAALYCHAQTDSTAKADEIVRLEQKLCNALPGDSAVWSKYLDPKWHLMDEDGNGSFRKDFLDGFKPFAKQVSGTIKVTKPVLSFHNNIAVINYVADEHETFYGQNLHTTYGTMDTWYKTDTSWMMLSMLSFEIPAWPPAITVELNTLKQYTGTYKLSDENTAVVSIKNDTLFIQKNKRKPEALFAETSNIFFRKSDARGRKFFAKDATGQMLLLERRNGQDVVWKKVD